MVEKGKDYIELDNSKNYDSSQFLEFLKNFFFSNQIIDNEENFQNNVSLKESLEKVFSKYSQQKTILEGKQIDAFNENYLKRFFHQGFVVGIDVGGTNTDSVLLELPKNISGKGKVATTKDIMTGVINSFKECTKDFNINKIKAVNIGTTAFINSVIQRSEYLNKVSVLRICGESTQGVPPYRLFPSDLRDRIEKKENPYFYLKGGYNYTGQNEIEQIDKKEIKEKAEAIFSDHILAMENNNNNTKSPLSKDIREIQSVLSIAVIGLFGTVNDNQEKQVKILLNEFFTEKKKKYKDFKYTITLSSEVGKLGIIERENATILNASLRPYAMKTIKSFNKAFLELGFTGDIYFTQNDGSIGNSKTTSFFPVNTFASGPVNSVRGASFLSHLSECIVADIGGTTTDFAIMAKGFASMASTFIELGGVRLGFRMPLVDSIGLGGGSIITTNKQQECFQGKESETTKTKDINIINSKTNDETWIQVGPESLGFDLTHPVKGGIAFGGKTITTTDIALKLGFMDPSCFKGIKNFNKDFLKAINEDFAKRSYEEIKRMIQAKINIMKTSSDLVPLVLVGGGSRILKKNEEFLGISQVIMDPIYVGHANAIGAGLNKISLTSESIYKEEFGDKKAYCKRLKDEVIENCIELGAMEGLVEIYEQKQNYLSYSDSKEIKIETRAIGNLDLSKDFSRFKLTSSSNKQTKNDDENSLDSHQAEDDLLTLNCLDNDDTVKDPTLKTPSHVDDHVFNFDQPKLEWNSESKRNEWLLTLEDLEFISIGATVLGCGGGGHPLLPKIIITDLLKVLKEPIRIISPDDLREDELCFSLAMYGSGDCGIEKLVNGQEFINSFKLTYDDYLRKSKQTSDNVKPIVFSVEIGGMNSIVPIIVAALFAREGKKVCVLDIDLMGRAYPTLNYITPVFMNHCIFPIWYSSDKGESFCITGDEPEIITEKTINKHYDNSKQKNYDWSQVGNLVFKNIKNWSLVSACTLWPYNKKEIDRFAVKHSLSRAWGLGRAICLAKHKKLSLEKIIKENENGDLIFKGMITYIEKKKEEGKHYVIGTLGITGIEQFDKEYLKISFRNEMLIAFKKPLIEDNNSYKGEILAAVPDLIALLSVDTYQTILVEDFAFGIKVMVFRIPSNNILRSNLDKSGLKSFDGLEHHEYLPFGECKEPISQLSIKDNKS